MNFANTFTVENGILIGNSGAIVSGHTTPQGNYNLPIYTIYIQSNGSIWRKTGNTINDWREIDKLVTYSVSLGTIVTTNSVTNVLLVGTQITVVNGNYMVYASTISSNNINGASNYFSLALNGNRVDFEGQVYRGNNNSFNNVRYTWNHFTTLNCNNNDVVSILWRTTSSSIATCHSRFLSLIRYA